jgi:hypothetical protein
VLRDRPLGRFVALTKTNRILTQYGTLFLTSDRELHAENSDHVLLENGFPKQEDQLVRMKMRMHVRVLIRFAYTSSFALFCKPVCVCICAYV